MTFLGMIKYTTTERTAKLTLISYSQYFPTENIPVGLRRLLWKRTRRALFILSTFNTFLRVLFTGFILFPFYSLIPFIIHSFLHPLPQATTNLLSGSMSLIYFNKITHRREIKQYLSFSVIFHLA